MPKITPRLIFHVGAASEGDKNSSNNNSKPLLSTSCVPGITVSTLLISTSHYSVGFCEVGAVITLIFQVRKLKFP